METAADGDALRALRGPAGTYEADASAADLPALGAGSRRSSVDRLAFRMGRGASASASTSPNMMPAAFLHQEVEPMVASRAASASPTTAFTSGFYGATTARGPSSSTSAGPSSGFHWSPTPLGGLFAGQTPLLAPSAAASALAAMSTASSVLNPLPPPTPTTDGGGINAHSWRHSTSLSTWSGPNSSGVAQIPPLALPPPPSSAKPAAIRRRKRPPGAQRLRNFLCMHPACGKSFTDSAHLRDHTVVHTGEKRLGCQLCGRRFARLSTLHEHQRVHTGEKPYACAAQDCSKRYSSRAALRVHVTTHSSAVGGSRRRGVTTELVAERLEERPELAPRFHDRDRDHDHDWCVSPYGGSAGGQQAYEVPPTTAGATYTAQTQHTTVVHSSQESTEDPARSLADTVREQQGQIARLQHELERLRQQPQPVRRKKPSHRDPSVATSTRRTDGDTSPAATVAAPMTAPVAFLLDGVKPFACCVCSQRFVNFYQLSFHAKQHAGASLATVVGQSQAPLPVGPKFCPEHGCEFSEAAGRSLRSLQTLKRHWQRRHQLDRPHVCAVCPPHQRKAFKTRENLKAHEKDCRRSLATAAAPAAAVSVNS